MLIQDEQNIRKIGIDWIKTVSMIQEAVNCLHNEDFAQPIKPYLRYGDPKNRIIAMPAFVGGEINMAGIKWISSFPENIKKGIPRAHSVMILNEAETGKPLGIINTALLSIIRTASVSGLVVKHFAKVRKLSGIKVGITGFGPIGRHHADMMLALFGDMISKVYVYDIRGVDDKHVNHDKIEVVDKWQDAYCPADIFITCTVADQPYIDLKPAEGSLHLNISLRDYKAETYEWFKDRIIVDDWEEVCRENTDIERFHIVKGLEKSAVFSITDVVINSCFAGFEDQQPIMFNPMGMAIFDVAIA
ncbi:2,3-diaminopropionate biosynthesis protein SbnB, partial [Fulvivirga sp.]